MSPLHRLKSDDNSTETPTPPPCREFFDVRSLSSPSSLLDARTRLCRNITHFQVNYSLTILQICYLYLGFFVIRPFTTTTKLFLLYLGATMTLYVAYVNCSCSPLRRCILLGLVAALTVIIFTVSHAWIHLLVVLVTCTAFVFLHGVLRIPNYGYHELLDSQPQSGDAV